MLPKHKYLLTYRYAGVVYDLTVEFVRKYINPKSRTKDQMEQAARSAKQNVVEGISEGQTSKKAEIKFLGFAKPSAEELLADYEDYLRQRGLEIYPKIHSKVTLFRQTTYRLTNLRYLSHLKKLSLDLDNRLFLLIPLCFQIAKV